MKQSPDKDRMRLENELYTALRASVLNDDFQSTETLLSVGARIDWLPRRLTSHLANATGEPVSDSGISANRRSGRGVVCLRRPWSAEEAYSLAYRHGTPDEPEAARLAIAACRGWPAAQHDLAVFLEDGNWGFRNLPLAVHWYRKAAAAGDAFAQNNLGTCLAKGRGIPFDGKAAVSWYRKSARQGCAEGLQNYAFCLLCGQCTKRKQGEAFRLAVKSFLKASSGRAAFLVGQCLRNGWGARKDLRLAKLWLTLASDRGYTWKTSGWKGCKSGQLPRGKKKRQR